MLKTRDINGTANDGDPARDRPFEPTPKRWKLEGSGDDL
jgi:hypothetical protein